MIRFFDVLLSILGLIFTLPVFIIVGVVIILESKGGMFYKQKRVGIHGIEFELFKFRSMYVNSDVKGLITVGGKDPRVTKVGYYVRKYKVDELPQLLNVILGDMSIVGPRPEVRKYVNFYTKEQQEILSVKPGITDFASIKFSNENEILESAKDPEKEYIKTIIPQKIMLNRKYIENKSFYNYVKIIFLTIKKVIYH